MRRRLAALVAVASLLGAACSGPSATASPTGSGSSGSPSASSSGTPSALAARVRDSIDVEGILRDLRRLEAVTLAAGGSRPAGTAGEAEAVSFVVQELERAGLEVTRRQVTVPVFRETGPGLIEIESSPARMFQAGSDFKPLLLSPSGDVTAPVVALGFDPGARPGSTGGAGCEAADWTGFAAGSIALVQPGPCSTRQVVDHAQPAGAVALVRSYPGWTAGHVLRPTLIDPAGLTMPVIGVTHAVGLAMDEAARGRVRVRVATETETTMRPAVDVLAETAFGDPAHVAMVGAHLDSVIDGPGINDDGSGAMALLEIARRLAALREAGTATGWRIRAVFWTGEEVGLWGSVGWFRSLTPEARGSIAAYLNLDMLGSPNGVRQVYRSSGGGNPAAALEALLGRSLDLEGLAWESVEAGTSDDLPFAQAGIPTSGLFSGDNTPKSQAQAERFGGVAGQPLDPCYHLACDTMANIDPRLLGQMARSAGWVTGYLASGEMALP